MTNGKTVQFILSPSLNHQVIKSQPQAKNPQVANCPTHSVQIAKNQKLYKLNRNKSQTPPVKIQSAKAIRKRLSRAKANI